VQSLKGHLLPFKLHHIQPTKINDRIRGPQSVGDKRPRKNLAGRTLKGQHGGYNQPFGKDPEQLGPLVSPTIGKALGRK